jgi:hypothetical protein
MAIPNWPRLLLGVCLAAAITLLGACSAGGEAIETKGRAGVVEPPESRATTPAGQIQSQQRKPGTGSDRGGGIGGTGISQCVDPSLRPATCPNNL